MQREKFPLFFYIMITKEGIYIKINLKVRFKNPVFWANLALAVVLPIFTYMGVNFEDITSWKLLFDILFEAVKNPVIVVSVIVSVWNLIHDPTTPGFSDSERALSYTQPGTVEDE